MIDWSKFSCTEIYFNHRIHFIPGMHTGEDVPLLEFLEHRQNEAKVKLFGATPWADSTPDDVLENIEEQTCPQHHTLEPSIPAGRVSHGRLMRFIKEGTHTST